MMDELFDFLGRAGDFLARHWPFIVYAIAFAFVGEVMKRSVLTPANVEALRRARDRAWNAGGWRRVVLSMPAIVFLAIPISFHAPITSQVVVTLFPMLPSSGPFAESGETGLRLYILLASIVSLGLYDFAHAVAKRKGLDIRLPGEEHERPAVMPARTTKPPPAPPST